MREGRVAGNPSAWQLPGSAEMQAGGREMQRDVCAVRGSDGGCLQPPPKRTCIGAAERPTQACKALAAEEADPGARERSDLVAAARGTHARRHAGPMQRARAGAAKHKPGSTFIFRCSFAGKPCLVLMDTGATRCFVARKWVRKHASHQGRLRRSTAEVPLSVQCANNEEVAVTDWVHGAVHLQGLAMPVEAGVFDGLMEGVDLILGMDFLVAQGIKLDCARGEAELLWRGKRRTLRPTRDRQPPLAWGAACALAMARAAAAPASLHLSANGAAREVKRGAHCFLLLIKPETDSTEMTTENGAQPAVQQAAVAALNARAQASGVPEEAAALRASAGAQRGAGRAAQGAQPMQGQGAGMPAERHPALLDPAEGGRVLARAAGLPPGVAAGGAQEQIGPSTAQEAPPPDPAEVEQLRKILRKVVGAPDDATELAAADARAREQDLVPPSELLQLLDGYCDDVFTTPWGPARGLPALAGHTIRLVDPRITPKVKHRRLSPLENAETLKQLQDLLRRQIIEPSASPFGAPILFVQKKGMNADGTPELRMCIDYRALNKNTIRDKFPIPRIEDLFDKLQGKTVLATLDLSGGYHQVPINPEDVAKTAFVTPHGQFAFRTLCFGLTNAPATFQKTMQAVLADFIGEGWLLVYLDDVLIASSNPAEHMVHLRRVMERLRELGLRAKLKKCSFNKPDVAYLGHIVGRSGVACDPSKVKAIQDWPVPTNVKDLQGFLGTCNWVRKYIPMLSAVAAPLTALTSKEVAQTYPWRAWRAPELHAFNQLKAALSQAPVLALPDFEKPFEVRTDASLYGTGGVLMQDGRVIAYTSKKFSPAERNYTTTEQELLGLVRAMQEWRCYLEGVPRVLLITDHHPLVYLQTQPNLSRRVVRWVEFLQRFNFEIKYEPGKTNIADPLSRGALVEPEGPVLETAAPLPGEWCAVCWVATAVTGRLAVTVPLTRERLDRALPSGLYRPLARPVPPRPAHGEAPPDGGEMVREEASAAPVPGSAQAPERTAEPMDTDGPGRSMPPQEPEEQANLLPAPAELGEEEERAEESEAALSGDITRACLLGYERDPQWADPEVTAQYTCREGLWYKGGQVVVPELGPARRMVLEACHDARAAGHVGITKTLDLVVRTWWWPTVRSDVEEYVRHCDACQRNKGRTRLKGGQLMPLSIPGRRWLSVSMDLVCKLPTTAAEGYDSILVFVDRLTKMVHLVPCKEKGLTAKRCAWLFIATVVRLHGVPAEVISDRGTQWDNAFWQQVCKLLGLRRCMSTAYHPQSDGQTERTNRTLQEMLRSYVCPTQRDWDQHLPMVEFAINNSWQESVQSTPFMLNYGQHPLTPAMARMPLQRVPAAHEFVQGIEAAVAKARACLQRAQERMKRYADRTRRQVEYKVGDLVRVDLAKLGRMQGLVGVRKLRARWAGPFKVLDVVNPCSLELELPVTWLQNGMHPVLHTEKLEPYLEPLPGQARLVAEPEPLRFLDGKPVHEVEAILDHQPRGRGFHYKIRWRGVPVEGDTWEPRSNLSCNRLLRAYKRAAGLPIQAVDGVSEDEDEEDEEDEEMEESGSDDAE